MIEITFKEAENYIGILLSISQEKSLKIIFPKQKKISSIFQKQKVRFFFASALSMSFGKLVKKHFFFWGVSFS